ncbi:hypothetical protein EDB83DRAFT_2680988, partial [Lactarius deliciosus]
MALDSLASGPGGETEEAISLFAEGTFEHQVAELVGYISSGRQDTERAPYFESIRQKLVVEDSQNLQFNDVGRNKSACDRAVGRVRNLHREPRQRTRPTARFAVPAPTSTNDSSNERQWKGALLDIRLRHSQSEAAVRILPLSADVLRFPCRDTACQNRRLRRHSLLRSMQSPRPYPTRPSSTLTRSSGRRGPRCASALCAPSDIPKGWAGQT